MTETGAPEIGASPNTWCDVVRRAELPSMVKLVALTMATYATNHTGADIYPGVARLAVDTGTSASTVKRAVAQLVQVGLLERVRRGARRAGLSDEYRLVMREDLLDHVQVRSPTEHRAAVTHVKHAMSRVSRQPGRDTSPELGETHASSGELGRGLYGSPESRTNGHYGSPETPDPALYGSPLTHHRTTGSAPDPVCATDHVAPRSLRSLAPHPRGVTP